MQYWVQNLLTTSHIAYKWLLVEPFENTAYIQLCAKINAKSTF